MTRKQDAANRVDWKAVMREDSDCMKALVRTVVQPVLDAGMEETLRAARSGRTPKRTGS